MKFLLLNTDYLDFLQWLYARHPGLERSSYEEQMQARNDSLFGVADFYSTSLRKLGHEAIDIHTNNEPMQRTWAVEHDLRIDEAVPLAQRARSLLQRSRSMVARTPMRHFKSIFQPVLHSLDRQPDWYYRILEAQINHYQPDILLNHDLGGIGSSYLKTVKPKVKLLVGQVASPLPEGEDLGCYDLMFSSLPNFVTRFQRMGLSAELLKFAFDPRVLRSLEDQSRKTPVSFVGSLSLAHTDRIRLLECVCQKLEPEVWGSGVEALPQESPVRRCYRGKAWGIEMYQILHNSRITLNHHIGVAETFANNMRLFEATGVGTLLVTDWKENLAQMFEPGKEVIAYHSPEECTDEIQYYLENEPARAAVARAGQERALRDHTYDIRMQELVEIVRKYL